MIVLNRFIKQIYKNYFSNIIFIKDKFENLRRNDTIECRESQKGFYIYMCFRNVLNKYPNMKGYLFIDDDNFVKPWELENLDLKIPWMNRIKNHFNVSKSVSPLKNSSFWKRLNNTWVNTNIILNKNKTLKHNYTKFFGSSHVVNVLVDAIYIPNTIINQFCDMVEIMYESRIFLQTAIPTVLGIMLLKKIHILTSIFLWGKERNLIIDYLTKSYSIIGIHPIKFTNKYNQRKTKEYINFINAIDY